MRTTIATGTIVATVLGIVEIVETWTGWKSGVTEDVILSVLTVVGLLAAWWGGRSERV